MQKQIVKNVNGVRNAVKRQCVTWYENIIQNGSTWEAITEQVTVETVGEHRCVNLQQSSIKDVISVWESDYSEYQKKLLELKSSDLEASVRDDQDGSTAKLPPREIPSPGARWSASHGKALQIIDGILCYFALPHHIKHSSQIDMLVTGKLNYERSPSPNLLVGCQAKVDDLKRASASDLQEYKQILKKSPLVPSLESQSLIDCFFQFYKMILGLYVLNLAESFLKTKLAFFEAYSKSQEEKELPSVPVEFHAQFIRSKNLFLTKLPSAGPGPRPVIWQQGNRGGVFGKTVTKWLSGDLVRAQEFVFNVKRLAPKASDEMLALEAEKSFKILTTPQVLKNYVLPSGPWKGKEYTLDDAELAVRRTVREKFSGKKWTEKVPFQNSSSHGHFDGGLSSRPRHLGGARGYLASTQVAEREILAALTRVIPFPIGIQWTRQIVMNHTVLSPYESAHLTLRTIFRPPEEECSDDPIIPIHWYTKAIQDIQARDSLIRAPLDVDGPLPAKIVTLAEPLKIRTITCGPSSDYYWAMYLQEWLHTSLRYDKTFELIGGTKEGVPIHRNNVQRRFRRPLSPEEFYASVDYKAATNLISGRLSEAAADEICKVCDLPSHIETLFKKALVHHMIETGELIGEQKNGQLMGSPASFPILCLINAALIRDSQEYANVIGPNTLLDDFELLINGDDAVFPTTRDGYEFWKGILACGGLHPSVGKTYTSREFLVMNSTMFRVGGCRPNNPMRSSGNRYLNGIKLEPTLPKIEQFEVSTYNITRDERTTELLTVAPKEFFLQPCHHTRSIPGLPSQVFNFTHWYNMDFLGPCGSAYQRAKPWESKHTTSKLHEKQQGDILEYLRLLLKKSRHHGQLQSISDLFLPENYQILPGIQKSWLGPSTGALRHKLNCLFLDTWKDVLMVGQHSPDDCRLGHNRVKGNRPFTTDWFMPPQLGGMGLEDTSGQGIRACSLHARKLAHYLIHHPLEHITSLPCLGEQPLFAAEVGQRVRKIFSYAEARGKLKHIPRSDVLPTGYVDEQDFVAVITRNVLFESFGSTYSWQQEKKFGGDYVKITDSSVALTVGIERSARSRARFFHSDIKKVWDLYAPLTQRQLNAWIPTRRVIRVDPIRPPDVLLYHREQRNSKFPRLGPTTIMFTKETFWPSGKDFPAMQHLLPVQHDAQNGIIATAALPFGWPEYEPFTDEEDIIMTNHYFRMIGEREEEKKANTKIGPVARAAGLDIFGDSEFDTLLDKLKDHA
jgi:hypothetical protein